MKVKISDVQSILSLTLQGNSGCKARTFNLSRLILVQRTVVNTSMYTNQYYKFESLPPRTVVGFFNPSTIERLNKGNCAFYRERSTRNNRKANLSVAGRLKLTHTTECTIANKK